MPQARPCLCSNTRSPAKGRLGTRGTGSLSPGPSDLSPPCSCKLTSGCQLQQQTVACYLCTTINTARGNSGSVNSLICSSVLVLGKTQEIWQETDTSANKSMPLLSLRSARLSYNSTAVLMKFTTVSIQLEEAVLNPAVTIIKLIQTWQICQNMHQDKHDLLILRSNVTAGLSVSCWRARQPCGLYGSEDINNWNKSADCQYLRQGRCPARLLVLLTALVLLWLWLSPGNNRSRSRWLPQGGRSPPGRVGVWEGRHSRHDTRPAAWALPNYEQEMKAAPLAGATRKMIQIQIHKYNQEGLYLESKRWPNLKKKK